MNWQESFCLPLREIGFTTGEVKTHVISKFLVCNKQLHVYAIKLFEREMGKLDSL